MTPIIPGSEACSSVLAYLDGGTGSMLLQAAVAGLLTAGYLVKTQWAHLKVKMATALRRDTDRRVR